VPFLTKKGIRGSRLSSTHRRKLRWRKELSCRGPPGLKNLEKQFTLRELKRMSDKKLELVFIDDEGNVYPITEVNSAELSSGLKNLSEEIATRLRLQKEQR